MTVKTIATTTPDSREDNNFREDDEPRTSTKMIAKTTPATATVKTIVTMTAPATTTPDSHEDDCEDDTRNGDGEDNRNDDGSRDYKPMTPDPHDTTTDEDDNGDGGRGPAVAAVDHGLHLHYICVDKPFKL